MIQGDSLFNEDRFAQVELSQDIQELIAQNPQGTDLVRLNQLLLLAAYPDELTASRLDSPYILDLARLAALLALPPWQEPSTLRESVEAYRQRLRRMVALYRNGLGTGEALQRMIEAQLPVNLEEPTERQDRPFWLEEFARLPAPLPADPTVTRAMVGSSFIGRVPTRGKPVDKVGPLMRWTVTNRGIESTVSTIYIQGVTPQPGFVAATERPLIELYSAGNALPPIGIAYAGNIPPDQVLRLRPAYASWIALESELKRSEALPTEDIPADPTAPGPWKEIPNADDLPSGTVADLLQTHDRALWIGLDTTLWRYNGQAWSLILEDLPQINSLVEDGRRLLIGTESGLFQLPLYPDDGEFEVEDIAGWEDQTINVMFQTAAGQWWVGTAEGAFQLGDGDSLQSTALQDTVVHAISQDKAGTLYFGTELSLFHYQPRTDRWFWYAEAALTEQDKEWEPFLPDETGDARNFPTADRVLLPPVRCVHRGTDASLWIGTDNGIARYVARSVRGLTFQTGLEAFPDLGRDRVYTLQEDARGVIWFGTDRGLFRYDGRDWWQFQYENDDPAPYENGTWEQLGRADTLYRDVPEPRGNWRFQRDTSQWQRLNLTVATPTWVNFEDEPRTQELAAVQGLFWTDHGVADLGSWDEARLEFTPTASGDDSAPFPDPVLQQQLQMRCKPNDRTIIPGGLPAIPRLPVGASVWRYLSQEPGDFVVPGPEERPRPWWTPEGRQISDPPVLPAPGPGRFDITIPPPASTFTTPPPASDILESGEVATVFAYPPAAKVWFEWSARQRASVLVRLKLRSPDEHLDPAIIDRVWQGIQQVRPAGVRTLLAVEEEIVRGTEP